MHKAGIKWFVVLWPTVLTSCTVEIPGLDDKAMLVEYKVLEVPVTRNKWWVLKMQHFGDEKPKIKLKGNALCVYDINVCILQIHKMEKLRSGSMAHSHVPDLPPSKHCPLGYELRQLHTDLSLYPGTAPVY